MFFYILPLIFIPKQQQNREYFAQFVTEDIENYVLRKRACNAHGNHIEIQAMSEMYNRPVELYCYQMGE
jgi:OTU domain-containing protein 5